MSLNGLDAQRVEEAYNAALAEPGAWFLLKYVSRDEVDILQTGAGGAAEARQAVANYVEVSPLYGFMHYRRRKVIIKYLPDGISRLLQARVSVHFQSVTDKFAPHDTVFTFSNPDQLKDSTLSAACSLHTASGSTASSNTSSTLPKLVDINEGAEDGQTPDAESNNHIINTNRREVEPSAGPGRSGVAEDLSAARDPVDSIAEEPLTSGSVNSAASPPGSASGHSKRAVSYDTYGFSSYNVKPKVKLGPRPSIDNGRRPHANYLPLGENSSQPVATLPAGLRAANRSIVPARPPSQSSQMSSMSAFTTSSNYTNAQRMQAVTSRPSSSGTVSSMTSARPMSSKSAKGSSLTYEKQRLQRALELRRNQLKSQADSVPTSPTTDGPQSLQSLEDSQVTQQPPSLNARESMVPEDGSVDHSQHKNRSDGQEPLLSASSVASDLALEQLVPSSSGPSQDGANEVPLGRAPSSAEEGDPIERADQFIPTSNSSTVNSAQDEIQEEVDEPAKSDNSLQTHLSETETIEPASNAGNDELDQTDQQTAVASSPRLQTSELRSCSQSLASLTSLEPPADSFSSPAKSEQDQGEKYISPQPRGPAFDSVRIELAAENSEDNYLSDDSFMEELQRAKVEEARPISVAKSPIEPLFPVGLSDPYSREYSPVSRAVSNPYTGRDSTSTGRLTPGTFFPEPHRSLSASYAENNSAQATGVPVAKRINVSSGISKRIKALEMLSNRESSNSPSSISRASTPDSASSLSTLRKPSVRQGFLKPPTGLVQDRDSPRRASSVSASPSSRDQEGVRRNFGLGDRARHSIISLHSSQPELAAQVKTSALGEKALSGENLAVATDLNTLHHSLPSDRPDSSRQLSVKSRTSSSSRRGSEPKSPTANGAESTNEKEEKKSSRASRILRRMSAFSSPTKKSSANTTGPSVKGEPLQDRSNQQQLPQGVQEIGEVNVQFPDTLLWKRRCLKMDGQGFISLAMAKADENSRAFTKRYHLSEFYEPAIPDLDRQELPHSVILDFQDGGGTLQCACENPTGQAQLLQVLREAYKTVNH
ncbi:hypothetical protein L228DRAFT_16526 [Xylona heveae TC161]|uniref:ADF-H domain-containing protein n=1 Tax=Xylona heveae (strain CBS 132557 / TC161) TaxID=1328760 RepID=A0A165JUV0_XYLHT|nr:hypothetical protein L228DRAFT_16526 [Xylona heveae TC161]KZF26661.1 hypothetical protein L228DRAFT_16526 [Xylona heveae TC161]